MGMVAVDELMLERIDARLRELTEKLDGATIIPAPEWLSITAAANRFDVSPDTVRRWIREGRCEARGSGSAREVRVSA